MEGFNAAFRETVERELAAGVFDEVNGVLVGKPMNEVYAEEYKRLLISVIDRPDLPIVFNVNVGHAMPRCIIPFGVPTKVVEQKEKKSFEERVVWDHF